MSEKQARECAEQACPTCGTCCGECECLPEDVRVFQNPNLFQRLLEDIETVFSKDPAARSTIEVLTSYPGLHAIWIHRLTHFLWLHKIRFPARFISHIGRWLTGIEIHPGAVIGRRFFIDHGMGVVIGETAEIGNDVLMYKGAVLGGVSLEQTKRHPTLRHGVVVGSNAVILGPIEIGPHSKVGSGAVVVKPVPASATVVGVPAKVVRINGIACPRKPDLRHEELPDIVTDRLRQLNARIEALEAQLRNLETRAEEAVRVYDDQNDFAADRVVEEEVERWR